MRTASVVWVLDAVRTVTGSLVLPFGGRFIDRRGPRLAVVGIAALFALTCGYMGLVRNVAMLLVGFVLIRGLGQGSLSLVSQHVVNLWFVRRRGLAVGLTGLGMAVATAFFPSLIDGLIQAHGWRHAYVMLGLLVAVTVLPVGALLFRSRPERYGLAPDGHMRAASRGAPAERWSGGGGRAGLAPDRPGRWVWPRSRWSLRDVRGRTKRSPARCFPSPSARRRSRRIRSAARARWEMAFFASADQSPNVLPPGGSTDGSKMGS